MTDDKSVALLKQALRAAVIKRNEPGRDIFSEPALQQLQQKGSGSGASAERMSSIFSSPSRSASYGIVLPGPSGNQVYYCRTR